MAQMPRKRRPSREELSARAILLEEDRTEAFRCLEMLLEAQHNNISVHSEPSVVAMAKAITRSRAVMQKIRDDWFEQRQKENQQTGIKRADDGA